MSPASTPPTLREPASAPRSRRRRYGLHLDEFRILAAVVVHGRLIDLLQSAGATADGRLRGKVAEEFKEFGKFARRIDATGAAACGLRCGGCKERCSPISGQEARQMSTALVPITPTADSDICFAGRKLRPRADFLAQLIADIRKGTADSLRRRAEPEVAIAAYGVERSDRRRLPAARFVARSDSLLGTRGLFGPQTVRSVWTSTWRCELRILTIKPTSTSTSPIIVSRKNVDVPARCTSRNSTSMTMKSAIAST